MTLTGDWHKVTDRFGNIGRRLRESCGDAMSESIALVEKTVVKHIDDQDLPWPPLSEKYARYKERTRSGKWRRKRRKAGLSSPRRLSEKMLIATGAYRNAITSHKISPFEGEVGVSRQEAYSGGEKIANIGQIMEEGTRDGRIPARPHWEPSAEEVEGKIEKRFEKALAEAFDV